MNDMPKCPLSVDGPCIKYNLNVYTIDYKNSGCSVSIKKIIANVENLCIYCVERILHWYCFDTKDIEPLYNVLIKSKSINKITNKFAIKLLYTAFTTHNFEFAEFLMSNYITDINIITIWKYSNETILIILARKCFLKNKAVIIKSLLDYGADEKCKNLERKTYDFYLTKKEKRELQKLLLETIVNLKPAKR
jgi:hypothetical protein